MMPRIICLSDAHIATNKLSCRDGDILINAGDATNHGTNLSVVLEKVETKDYKLNNQTIALSKYKLIHPKSGLEMKRCCGVCKIGRMRL